MNRKPSMVLTLAGTLLLSFVSLFSLLYLARSGKGEVRAFEPYRMEETADTAAFMADPLQCRTVVIDAAGLGENRAFCVSEAFRRRYGNGRGRLCFFYTRTGFEEKTSVYCLSLAQSRKADFYIRIEDREDMEGLSCAYNELYYRRGLTNVAVSDMILRYVCAEGNYKALGLVEAYEEDAVLAGLSMPATKLQIGALAELSSQENDETEMAEAVARGIYRALTAMAEKED